jgi:hypothetical protein
VKFPFVVIPELSDRHMDRFRRHVDSDASGWHRRWTESIWRRHQHPSNARLSGWASEQDRKRRIVHFYDEYGLDGRAFVLRQTYLWLNLTLPEEHIEEYRAAIAARLEHGEWQRDGSEGDHAVFRRGDLVARVAFRDVHPEDRRRGLAPPPSYRNLELSVRTQTCTLPAGWDTRPWKVFFDVGLRKTLARRQPRVIPPEEVAEYLPAQLELGCGPSIEAGIPHLSTLHRIYGVSHPDYAFVFRAKDDALLDILSSPRAKYAATTDIYRACMVAEPTDFYRATLDMWKRGWLVGPVITNNFDCQCADLGLPEISLRRYDATPYYPTIEYDPRARSLLVVGVHADRRLVQMRARDRGLRVVFVDPERYVAPDGREIPYPVEAPQDEDLFVRCTAQDAFTRLHRALEGRTPG